MGMCVREKEHRVEMWKLQLKQSLSANLNGINFLKSMRKVKQKF